MNKEKPFLIRVLSNKGVDFFILFLAITLGFFVDNYRDHYEANESVEAIAADLVSDIADDTAEIHFMLHNAYEKGDMLDSLCDMLDDSSYAGRDSLLYWYSSFVNRRVLFERHNDSYNLLVSTGYLRYFSKDAGAALTEYDIVCKSVNDLLAQERQLLNSKVYPFQQGIFNIDNFHSIQDEKRFVAPLVIRNFTGKDAFVYRNYISEIKLLNVYIIQQYKLLLESAAKTQVALKKEYAD